MRYDGRLAQKSWVLRPSIRSNRQPYLFRKFIAASYSKTEISNLPPKKLTHDPIEKCHDRFILNLFAVHDTLIRLSIRRRVPEIMRCTHRFYRFSSRPLRSGVIGHTPFLGRSFAVFPPKNHRVHGGFLCPFHTM